MMKSTEVFSPFYNIRRSLKLLRWTFGFPLQGKDDSFTEFRFVVWLEGLRFLVLSILLAVVYVYWTFVLLIVDGNLHKFINLATMYTDNYSRSKLDNVMVLLYPIYSLGMSFCYLLFFKWNTQSINSFCKKVTIIRSKLVDTLIKGRNKAKQTCRKGLEKSEKLIISGQIFNLISMLWVGLWFYNLFRKLPKDNIVYHYGSNYELFYPLLAAINSGFLFFGPMSCAAELLICQMINSLSDLFKDWTKILQNKPRLVRLPATSPQYAGNRKSVNDLETAKT